jgi:ribose 5-phosphate isomerase
VKEVSPTEGASLSRARQTRAAAGHAVDHARSGRVAGFGAGSTERSAVARLAERMAEGRLSDISAVPSRVGVRR